MTIEIPPPSSTVTESFTLDGSHYQRRLIRCGKPNCHRCPHGPYTYKLVYKTDGVARWLYRGKTDPRNGETQP